MLQQSIERLYTTLVREVEVPTATAIVRSSTDPHVFLIGTSAKHAKAVLPGGKIDCQDLLYASIEKCAEVCISRELREELGSLPLFLQFIARTMDGERDVRTVAVETLRGTLAESAVCDLPDGTLVRARYGMPDYLFIAEVEPEGVRGSEELANLQWVDSRFLSPDALSAGHGELVARYLEWLSLVEAEI